MSTQGQPDGLYWPGELHEVRIPTYTGKRMLTFVPPVLDRLVHRALRNAIEPVLEERAFRDWVSGFRPGLRRMRTQAAGGPRLSDPALRDAWNAVIGDPVPAIVRSAALLS